MAEEENEEILNENKTSDDVLLLTHSITNSLFNQIHQHKSPNRTVLIDLYGNLTTTLDNEILDYLIDEAKTQLRTTFSLVKPSTFLIFAILYGISIIFGLVSNITIVYTFYKCKKLRNFRNVYIVNLAIRYMLGIFYEHVLSIFHS